MSDPRVLAQVKVILLRGRVLPIRNPDLVRDVTKLEASKEEDLVLDGSEHDVRGRIWIIFPAHRNLGLPLDVGNPSIRNAWDDADIEIFRITPNGTEEEYFQ